MEERVPHSSTRRRPLPCCGRYALTNPPLPPPLPPPPLRRAGNVRAQLQARGASAELAARLVPAQAEEEECLARADLLWRLLTSSAGRTVPMPTLAAGWLGLPGGCGDARARALCCCCSWGPDFGRAAGVGAAAAGSRFMWKGLGWGLGRGPRADRRPRRKHEIVAPAIVCRHTPGWPSSFESRPGPLPALPNPNDFPSHPTPATHSLTHATTHPPPPHPMQAPPRWPGSWARCGSGSPPPRRACRRAGAAVTCCSPLPCWALAQACLDTALACSGTACSPCTRQGTPVPGRRPRRTRTSTAALLRCPAFCLALPCPAHAVPAAPAALMHAGGV